MFVGLDQQLAAGVRPVGVEVAQIGHVDQLVVDHRWALHLAVERRRRRPRSSRSPRPGACRGTTRRTPSARPRSAPSRSSPRRTGRRAGSSARRPSPRLRARAIGAVGRPPVQLRSGTRRTACPRSAARSSAGWAAPARGPPGRSKDRSWPRNRRCRRARASRTGCRAPSRGSSA